VYWRHLDDRSDCAPKEAVVDVRKQTNPPPPAAAAAVATVRAAWFVADLNGDGVLDPDEALVYAAALTSRTSPGYRQLSIEPGS